MRGTVAVAVCLAVALSGCSALQPQSLRIDSAAGMYRGVTLTYRVDSGQLSEPLTVARIAAHQVTQESVPSSSYPDRSVARLSIRFPHPDGKAGYALAELVVVSRAPPKSQVKKAAWQQWVDGFAATARDILPGMKLSDDVHEAWAMDVAKSDLDRVIMALEQSGYFANPSKAGVGVELAVRVDNFQANKNWTREPALDILMERIRQEGRLISYEHPATEQGAPSLAAGHAVIPAQFVAQDDAGPSLFPAGPQNNAYSNPPEPTAPVRRPPYTPPAMPYTQQSLPSPQAAPITTPPDQRPTLGGMRRPAVMTPRASTPPALTSPADATPSSKPKNRWQLPPQFRRQPGQVQAPATSKQTQPPAPQGAARNPAAQRQQRMPGRRPNVDPRQQPTAGPLPYGANPPGAARSRMPTGQALPPMQPPSANRMPPRSRGPARTPRAPNSPYSGAPQATAPVLDGSPAGLPQPPQLNPAPPQISSRPAANY